MVTRELELPMQSPFPTRMGRTAPTQISDRLANRQIKTLDIGCVSGGAVTNVRTGAHRPFRHGVYRRHGLHFIPAVSVKIVVA